MKKGANNSYFGNLWEGIQSSFIGLKLSFLHFFQAYQRRNSNLSINQDNYFDLQTGMITLRYPLESLPMPDNGRYRLYNEMDDCIVCDKCAKVCPVDCIEIEPIKATEQVGTTSDGSAIRLYAAKFDIDMAKCCFCGLCTTVCPTECLTMTKTYDFSEFEVDMMNYHFSNLTPEQAEEKKMLLDQYQKEKAAAKPIVKQEEAEPKSDVSVNKPKFIPKMKPTLEKEQEEEQKEIKKEEEEKPESVSKPKFIPKMKPVIKPKNDAEE